MLIAIRTFNNITAHKLFTAYCGGPLNSYHYQITNNFKKLLDQESAENTLMITALIFLVFRMHIGPTTLLKNGIFNA